MDTRYIKEFVSLAEACSFQKTAEDMYISQSSLSKHIKKIEEELGVPLFDRTTRSVELSEYGVVFYEYAKKIIKLCDEYTGAINEILISDDNKLSVGFLPRLGQYGIVEIMSEFSKKHPYISLKLVESNSISDLIYTKKCDFIFATKYKENESDLKRILYQVDNLAVVLPLNHPLAQENNITIEQLRDENFIMHSDITGNESLETRNFKKLCLDSGFEPKEIATVSFTSTIVKMVSQGLGISVINRIHMPTENALSVALVDIEPLVPFHIYVLYLKNSRKTLAAADFLNYIEPRGVS